MTAPCQQKQVIEFAEKVFGCPFFIADLFALAPRDLSLDTIFVKAAKNIIEFAAKIQTVNHRIVTLRKFTRRKYVRLVCNAWSYFNVLTIILSGVVLYRREQLMEFFRLVDEWLAVIGKGKGYQTPAG